MLADFSFGLESRHISAGEFKYREHSLLSLHRAYLALHVMHAVHAASALRRVAFRRALMIRA